jgi:predicted secreted protein
VPLAKLKEETMECPDCGVYHPSRGCDPKQEKEFKEKQGSLEQQETSKRNGVLQVGTSDGLSGFITVPRDPRTKKAQVTSEMKKMCIGEFTFMRDSHHDEFGDGVVETIEVPWTTVKEIYKAMVEAAERTAT